MTRRNVNELFRTGQADDMLPHEKIVYFAFVAGGIRQQGDLESEAFSRRELGTAYYAEQRFEEAVEAWLQSLQLFENLHDEQAQALVLDDLGTISVLSDLDLAQKYYMQGLRITSTAGLAELTDTITGHLLTMLREEQRTGRDRPARSYVDLEAFAREQGLTQIADTTGRILGRMVPTVDEQNSWWPYDTGELSASQLNDHAIHCLVDNQSLRAIRIFQRILRDLPEGTEVSRTSAFLYNIGDAYREIGLWEDAAPYLTQALTGYLAAGRPSMEATIAYYLAGIYREMGDTESTVRYARLGIKAGRIAGRWEAENRAALAAALFDLGQPWDACAELARCLSVAQSATHPSRFLDGQADKLLAELAEAWSIAPRTDPSEMAVELGRRLSMQDTDGMPGTGPDSLLDLTSEQLLHRLAIIFSTPETGEERWRWNRRPKGE
jgi:tetratricopeptide (TPR) repeat protein